MKQPTNGVRHQKGTRRHEHAGGWQAGRGRDKSLNALAGSGVRCGREHGGMSALPGWRTGHEWDGSRMSPVAVGRPVAEGMTVVSVLEGGG